MFVVRNEALRALGLDALLDPPVLPSVKLGTNISTLIFEQHPDAWEPLLSAGQLKTGTRRF
jgi:hypothetical protein